MKFRWWLLIACIVGYLASVEESEAQEYWGSLSIYGHHGGFSVETWKREPQYYPPPPSYWHSPPPPHSWRQHYHHHSYYYEGPAPHYPPAHQPTYHCHQGYCHEHFR